ncbi:hypothetical protein F4780DRAFT_74388 [Xylariomycetidae sp. FL0641]|nr:hypothetical protein F4780DRAFT_74388 [Xylariomycetidae sp. FL0641]
MEEHPYSRPLGRFARHLLAARKECHPSPDINLCEKPTVSSPTTEILIGVVAGILFFGTASVLFFLHKRRQRLDQQEWPDKDNSELEAYGMDVPPPPKGNQRGVNPPQKAYQQPETHELKGGAPASPLAPKRDSDRENLERNLRDGPKTTNDFRARVDDDVDEEMRPVQPTSQV